MTDRLELLADQLIAKGWHRECYLHPANYNLCVKVVVNGDDTETRREQAYYRHLEQRLTDWQSIPRFHGEIPTNLGMGAVFDLVRDGNGQVAKTLAHYLEDQTLFHQYQNTLRNALKALYSYQLAHNVLTMSLKPKNLLFQLDIEGNGTVHIIDNLGNADFIPAANYLPLLGRAKIKRKWQRFLKLLAKQYPFVDSEFMRF